MSSIQTFTADLAKWQAQVKRRSDALLRDTTMELFDQVQVGGEFSPGTPMVTGHARASWQVSRDDLPGGEAAASPEAAREQALSVASQARAGETLFIGNTADYIRKLEFGSSDQAPQGMMRLAASAVGPIVNDVTERIARGPTR